MFERVIIRTMTPEGWPIDWVLKPGQDPREAIAWLAGHGYMPAYIDRTGIEASNAEADHRSATFPADKLVASVDEGKVYWRVKGGRYRQYGVSIWPEVLQESGFDPDALDPLKTYDLTSMTAHYITNEAGNPQKVVKLTKN